MKGDLKRGLQKLIDDARNMRMMTDAEREQQRRSFAYGNTRMANPDITMEIVNEQDELLKKEKLDA